MARRLEHIAKQNRCIANRQSDDARILPREPFGHNASLGFRIYENRWRGIIVAVVALLMGMSRIAYPLISNYVNQVREKSVIEASAVKVASADNDTLTAERERALTYNQQLLAGRAVVTDPFDPDAERPTDEDYNAVMNLAGDGVMGTLNIPSIHLELPIYHTVDTDVLEHGVGHLEGTSLPIGGDSSHCVVSGHTGLPTMKIFDNLDQLEVGDCFIISVLGEDHAYQVTSTEVVLPDETDSLVIQEGKGLCTLVTCTPYGVNTHRLLVHAERCEVPEEWLNKGDAAFPAGCSDPPDRALLPSVRAAAAGTGCPLSLWESFCSLRALPSCSTPRSPPLWRRRRSIGLSTRSWPKGLRVRLLARRQPTRRRTRGRRPWAMRRTPRRLPMPRISSS